MIRPAPHIAAMAPYALADLSGHDGPLIELAQNESLRPPSPSVAAAMSTMADKGARYPDPNWTALRHAISEVHRVDPANLLCGAGSLDLIGALARVYAGPDRAMLVPRHAYPFFRTAAAMAGARCDVSDEVDLTVSVDALLDQVQPDTAVVCVANPGNPTGTRLPRSEVLRLRAGLRPDILLVLDEAYGEFADGLDAPMFDIIEDGRSCVLRTLSKAYGLAGVRVGWGVFPPDMAAQIRKVMNPNNLSTVAQAAACAALRDQAYMRETCALTATGREAVAAHLRDMPVEVIPSATNFVLLRFASPQRAGAVDACLRSNGVIVRGQGGADLPDCLRITIGPPDDMTRALHLISDALTQKDMP